MKIALSVARAPRMLVRSTRLLAAIGGLAMATTGECSPIVLAAFLAFFLIGMRVEAFPTLLGLLGAAQPVFALLVFALAVADFFTVSQSFLLAVAHFLLGLQALRLTALRTNRENLGSVLVSSLMVLSASTLAVDWTFFVMLALFLPAVVWTLMLHTIALESDLASGGEASQALQGSNPVWRQMAPALRRAAAAAFAIAGLCCAFVFLTFPRFNFQGFRGQFLQPLHKTGFTNQVDLEKTGRIYEDPSIVMRVEVPEADRARWTGYLRGSVLEQFDGRLWLKASRPIQRIYPASIGEFRLRASGSGAWIRQSIYLESMDTPVIFAASHPFFVRIDRPFLEVAADGTLQRRQSDAWRIHYEVISAPSAASEPFLTTTRRPRPAITTSETIFSRTLPIEGQGRIAAVAAEVGGTGTPAEIAERLANYLRSNFTYTLEPAPADSNSPIERFLFKSRKGHCEYFASALALMLRHRQIPARIVTGFLSREWNERGHYYIVRMRHAHAWVEYWSPGTGWTEIDPSPRSTEEGDETGGWQREARQAWDYMNLRWNRYILSYDLEKQVAIIRSVSSKSSRLSGRVERLIGSTRRLFSLDGLSWKPKVLARTRFRLPVGPFIAIAVVIGLYFGLRAWRFRGGGRVWFHRPLVKLLVKAGAVGGPGRTLREMLKEAEPRLGAAAEPAGRLADTYYRLRFSPETRASAEERRFVQQTLAEVRRGLASARQKH